MDEEPIRVAIANDYEIVVRGLAAMLAGDDGIEVVELVLVGSAVNGHRPENAADNSHLVEQASGNGHGAQTIEEAPAEQSSGPADVVLYDTYGREGIDQPALRELLQGDVAHHVAVFTLSWSDELVRLALDRGVHGVLAKSMRAGELAKALHAVATGEIVVSPPPAGRSVSSPGRTWPGRALGLSERESEVMVLLAQGLRNSDIARALYVGDETIKTHVKRAYRKLGVGNRAQATNLVLRHPAFGNV